MADDPRAGRRFGAIGVGRWLAVATFLVAASWLLVLTGGRGRTSTWTVTTIAELWLLGGLVAVALRSTTISARLRACGPVRTGALAVLGVLLLLGQHARGVDLWPFTRWDMYSQPFTGQVFVEINGVVDGNRVGALPLDQVLPMAAPRTFLGPLFELTQRATRGDLAASEALDATLTLLGERAGWEPGTQIEVRRCLVRQPTETNPARCEVVHVVELEPAG
jgi:hypothetical protein